MPLYSRYHLAFLTMKNLFGIHVFRPLSVNLSLWQSVLLFLFCFAVLWGPGFSMFDTFNYDFTAMPDIKTYLGLARFDFIQSPVRRYRILVPLLAAAVDFVGSPIAARLKGMTFPGPDFSLCLSFFVVNCCLMSLCGLVVFRLCRAYAVSSFAAVVGVLSVLTCRWASYVVGLPLVDSLYMLVCVSVLYGIRTKNDTVLVCCIFVGPWAKESFVFIAPLIFFYSGMNKRLQILYFVLSGLIVFAFRYSLDRYCGAALNEGLVNDFAHFGNIAYSLRRLCSFHGVYELFSIPGIWSFLFFLVYQKQVRVRLSGAISPFFLYFLLAVFIHAVLSTDLARMLFLAAPVLAVWLSIIADQLISSLSSS